MKNIMKKAVKGFSNIFIALVFAFLYLPIVVVIIFSFNTSKLNIEFKGFTFAWYGRMLHNGPLMNSFKNTLIVAACSTLLSLIIGTLAAVGMYRYRFRGKGIVDSLLYIPVVIPEIVMGISLLAFFTLFHITTGMFTLIIAHVTFSMPFVVITVRARTAGYDYSVEEAAMDLGATRTRTFMKVTLPILLPGVFAGGMLALSMSLDDVIVSYFTTGITSTTLPIEIYNLVRTGITPDVNALSTVIIGATLAVMLAVLIFKDKVEKDGRSEKTAPR